MPGFDRTGPQGVGPMTGGARGLCNPADTGYARGYGYGRGMAYGRGFRGGFGAGRGMRRGVGAGRYPQAGASPAYPFNETNELDMLKAQASDLKGALDEINHRITELEKRSE